MRLLALFIALLFMTSCSQPIQYSELSHMRKSKAIETILENMDQINYDESFSEIDRDRLNLGYASDLYQEIFTLTVMLKKHRTILPNKKPIPKSKMHDYQRIMKLLDANLLYLKKVIDNKEETLILSAVKRTEKTCTQCHIQFKNSL